MNASYISQSTRPNLHNISTSDLEKIINDLNYNNIDALTPLSSLTRDEMVSVIFKLWAEHEILDHNSKQIECLICCEFLTNGDNLTFECGHKFHSKCIIAHVVHSTIERHTDLQIDNEKNKDDLKYKCPQCKKEIYSTIIDKIQINDK